MRVSFWIYAKIGMVYDLRQKGLWNKTRRVGRVD